MKREPNLSLIYTHHVKYFLDIIRTIISYMLDNCYPIVTAKWSNCLSLKMIHVVCAGTDVSLQWSVLHKLAPGLPKPSKCYKWKRLQLFKMHKYQKIPKETSTSWKPIGKPAKACHFVCGHLAVYFTEPYTSRLNMFLCNCSLEFKQKLKTCLLCKGVSLSIC